MAKHYCPFRTFTRDLLKLLQILRRKEAKTQLRAYGIAQKIPLIGDIKYTACARASSFIRKHHRLREAVMAGQNVRNPRVFPWTEDHDKTWGMLDGFRRFTLLVKGDLVPFPRF
jgi:hypothetical protein